MRIAEAKKIEVGTMVVIKNYPKPLIVESFEKSLSSEKRISFWANGLLFSHKDVERIVG